MSPPASETGEADARWRRIGAGLAGLGVAAGAFGAHVLEHHARLDTWKTGALYHLIHGIALCIPGLPRLSRRFLLAGTAIFSGSLYLLVLLDEPRFGAITPIGGVALILGWLLAARPGKP